MKVPSLRALSIATVLCLGAGFALVFFYAPLEREGFIQKIFYLHVPLAICSLVGFVVAGLHAIRHLRTGDPVHDVALLRLDPPLGDLRGRRAAHGVDLGPRLMGQVVGLGRAHPGQLPDRLPAVCDLLPAALRDRGPRPPGSLRVGVRDHRGRLRAAELHRRPDGAAARSPARVRAATAACPARCCSPSSSAWRGMALLWICLVRFELAAKSASAKLSRLRRALEGETYAAPTASRIAPGVSLARRVPAHLMPALPLDEAGKYVAAAYVVFVALILIYVAIMAAKLAADRPRAGRARRPGRAAERSGAAAAGRRAEGHS